MSISQDWATLPTTPFLYASRCGSPCKMSSQEIWRAEAQLTCSISLGWLTSSVGDSGWARRCSRSWDPPLASPAPGLSFTVWPPPSFHLLRTLSASRSGPVRALRRFLSSSGVPASPWTPPLHLFPSHSLSWWRHSSALLPKTVALWMVLNLPPWLCNSSVCNCVDAFSPVYFCQSGRGQSY